MIKYLMAILLVSTLTACGAAAPLAVGGIGIVTGISATTNIPKVKEFGEKHLKAN